MPDWLGYESAHAAPGSFLPFERARVYVHTLKLKSSREWKEWSKSGQRPVNISSNPHQTYRDEGWVSYPDWLGYKGGHRSAAAGGGGGGEESADGGRWVTGGEGKKRKLRGTRRV